MGWSDITSLKNPQSVVGTWSNVSTDASNFLASRKFGKGLFLPTAGLHNHSNRQLLNRSYYANDWISTLYLSADACYLNLNKTGVAVGSMSRTYSFSVRCIAE